MIIPDRLAANIQFWESKQGFGHGFFNFDLYIKFMQVRFNTEHTIY